MTIEDVRNRIDAAFRTLTTTADPSHYSALLSSKAAAGKLYEAFVLTKVAEELVTQEGMSLTLVNTNNIALKSAPGRINRRYPRIDAAQDGETVAELWTDVEFVSLSYCHHSGYTSPTRGDYHELDILMVQPGLSDRPHPEDIRFGVECKSTEYEKKLLREILGIRRELSYFTSPQPTGFSSWPHPTVPATPPSCLLVYSTDPAVVRYSRPGATFGIDFFHEPL